jgi:hypothetical protein
MINVPTNVVALMSTVNVVANVVLPMAGGK